MATVRLGGWVASSAHLRINFVVALRTRRFVGSDVVSVSQNSRLDATDYVGQASRRYRIWRGGFSPFRLILMKL